MNPEEHRKQLSALINANENKDVQIEIGFAASLADDNKKLKNYISFQKLMGKDMTIGFAAFMPKKDIKLRRI